MEKIAIYDMDRTVTRRGTYTPFLLFAARRRIWRMPLLAFYFLAMPLYAGGLIQRRALKELGFRLAVGARTRAERLASLSGAFADRVCATNLCPHIVDQIAADRADGCTLVLATAAPEVYAGAIAARLGFDHVIATRHVRFSNGDYSCAIDGENCYGPAKLRAIERWLPVVRGETEIRFYSDHHTDGPVFEWCDLPVATNPNEKLRALAEARQWRIITQR